jgi:hypothetical protein
MQHGPRIVFYGSSNITIDQRFYLFSAPIGTEFLHQELFDALRAIDVAICPHLRTSNPHLRDNIELTTECSLGIRDDPKDDISVHWVQRRCSLVIDSRYNEKNCIVWSKCPNPHCDTKFGLRRLCTVSYPLHHIILDVRRCFMTDATHPSWVAQVESEEVTEDIPESSSCDSRHVRCKGPVCASKHSDLLVGPF